MLRLSFVATFSGLPAVRVLVLSLTSRADAQIRSFDYIASRWLATEMAEEQSLPEATLTVRSWPVRDMAVIKKTKTDVTADEFFSMLVLFNTRSMGTPIELASKYFAANGKY